MAKTVKTPQEIEAAKQAANEKRRVKAAEKRAADKAAKEAAVAAVPDNPAPADDSEVLTGDPKGSDPTPQFRGKTGDEIAETTPAAGEIFESEDETDPFVRLAMDYAKSYPDNETFHITSDKQVFLEGDINLARLHQNGVDKAAGVKSIRVKTLKVK